VSYIHSLSFSHSLTRLHCLDFECW
jgi:hypothetical protein